MAESGAMSIGLEKRQFGTRQKDASLRAQTHDHWEDVRLAKIEFSHNSGVKFGSG